jgi:hypothetical protein
MLESPPAEFHDIILVHFFLKKQIILERIDKWIIQAE